ncbi:MAG: HEAT repeat domain-containing protein [Elusimicrobia bacterium]|nr:HEAT repeat domain-containing protein [Elusimicrobiota bacterium]
MKKYFIFPLFFYALLSLSKGICLADMLEKKPIIIPKEMKEITTILKLTPYLDSPDERLREAAVMRLGEIGGGEVVKLLVEIFKKEPYRIGMEFPEGVKEAVLTALGKIKSEEAKRELLIILDDYIKSGPKYKGRSPYIHDLQYYRIVRITMESLSNWKDNETLNIFFNILNDDKLFYGIREYAYKNYLKLDMHKKGIITMKERCNYLTGILTGSGHGSDAWIRGKSGVKTLDAIKNGAIEDYFIWDERKLVLPYLEDVFRNLPKVDFKRKESIRQIIKRIEVEKKDSEYKVNE